jgi:hypothetical protein
MDIVASILELLGLWLIGNRTRLGFVCSLFGCAAWCYVAVTREVYGLLIIGVAAIIINARNWWRWRTA